MGRMQTVTVYLTDEQIKKVKRLNEITKVPTSVRIRDAVDHMLKQNEKVFEDEEV